MSARRKISPAFGSLAAVDPKRLMLLPQAMQGEGVRLMMERGATPFEIAGHLGLSGAAVASLAGLDAPFKRGGEDAILAEGK